MASDAGQSGAERYGNMIYTLEIERFGAFGLSEMAERHDDLRHAEMVHDVAKHLATLGPGDEVEALWRVELRQPHPKRAEEWPMFVWGYRSQS